MNNVKAIGIIANSQKQESAGITRFILDAAKRRGIKAFLDTNTACLMGKEETHEVKDLGRKSDLIIILGGDGTLLQVAHGLKGSQTPVLGINLGGLGFLTAVGIDEAKGAMAAILAGKFITSSRAQIHVEVYRDDEPVFRSLSLNEVVICRAEVLRTIRIDIQVDHEEFTTYAGDGLIVSTPTGSTAYNLSGGGPVVHPEADVFVLTPICPHALANRSIVLSDRSCISARIHEQDYLINLTVDGQEQFALEPTDRVVLRKAKEKVQLAKLEGYSYYQVLREKLKWRGSNIEVKK
ncbi:MAG: NAD(+)/NADH kinase [Verrucomicrobiota bacterium]|nr:NAD(+)/NADH kinase [Verrucomicrobiota bacterium]